MPLIPTFDGLILAKQNKVDDYLQRYGHLTPKTATIGYGPATGAVVDSIADIDPILENNKNRDAYEMGKSRERLNLEKGKQDAFTDGAQEYGCTKASKEMQVTPQKNEGETPKMSQGDEGHAAWADQHEPIESA